MRRNSERKPQHTTTDHRPMIPELRTPGDGLDVKVRRVRRQYQEVNPNEQFKWR